MPQSKKRILRKQLGVRLRVESIAVLDTLYPHLKPSRQAQLEQAITELSEYKSREKIKEAC